MTGARAGSDINSIETIDEISRKEVVIENDIGWRVDPSGRAILVSVIDNLLKGASGQAVQNMNVMLGLDERTALL